MNAAFMAVLLMSATGILLVLCLCVLRPLTAKSLTATWHYRMYLLVVLFLLIPVGILGSSLFKKLPLDSKQQLPNVPTILNEMITAPQPDTLPQQAGQPLPQRAPPAGTTVTPVTTGAAVKTVLSFLPVIWLVGVFVFIVLHGIQLVRFKRKIMRTSLQIDNTVTLLLLKNAMHEMGLKGKPRLLSNNIMKTPMLTGLFRTVLILPEVEMSERELNVIFKHELTHFKRRDLLVKSLTLAANAIHWFNPAAYRLTKEIDTFCELSCDEWVVSDMSREERQFYGETILNVLCRVVDQYSGVYATLAESKKGIERRLTHMMNVKKQSKWMILMSRVTAVILCLIGFTTAAVSMAVAAPAAAEVTPMPLQSPYHHAPLMTDAYPFETSDDSPYYRLWIRNFDSEKVIGVIDYADGTQKQFAIAAAGEAGYSDYTSEVINPGAGTHEVTLRAAAGGTLNGALSIHVDSARQFQMVEEDEVSFQDPYHHAGLTTAPYLFETSDDSPYFRLWMRNFDSHKIYGTITYDNGSTKEFTVEAAGTVGYSDYSSAIIAPGSGIHSVRIRGEAGYTMSGALSIHVDSSALSYSI